MSRNTKKEKVKKESLKNRVLTRMKEPINKQLDEYLERGDSLTKGDLVRFAKGMIKKEIDQKVPAPLKKTADPTGLKGPLSRSSGIGSTGAGAKKLTRAEKKTQRKARKAKKKQAKRRDHAMGLAAFTLALVVGVVYKLTSKF